MLALKLPLRMLQAQALFLQLCPSALQRIVRLRQPHVCRNRRRMLHLQSGQRLLSRSTRLGGSLMVSAQSCVLRRERLVPGPQLLVLGL